MTIPSPSDEPESVLPEDEPAGDPSRVRGRVIAAVIAAVAFVAGIAIGAVAWSGDGDEPEEPVAASSDIGALEEQVATLQGQVDELTSERDGLRASVTELETAAEAAAAATATPAAQETPASPPATQPPAPPATPAGEDEAPPAAGDPYPAGQFEFTDVQVSDDGIGGFALRARVTNTGEAVAGALWTATLFLDGVVVATLNGSAQSFAADATLTAEFWSADPFGEYDAVEFQVDGQY